MRRFLLAVVVATTMSATGLSAQMTIGPMRASSFIMTRDGGRDRGAEFLLAHTGELQLTDAQVVRLAAIARRAETRRKAMRTSLDSLRPREPVRADSIRRGERMRIPENFDALRRTMEQQRDQERAELRDAIAVLTADQQAQAWEMVSGRGGDGPGFGFRFDNLMRGAEFHVGTPGGEIRLRRTPRDEL